MGSAAVAKAVGKDLQKEPARIVRSELCCRCFLTLALLQYIAPVVAKTRVPALTSNHQLPRPVGCALSTVKSSAHINCTGRKRKTFFPGSSTMPKGLLPGSRRPGKQRQK